MTKQVVKKVLAAVEDLLVGFGTTTQQRGSTTVEVTKVEIPAYIVDSEDINVSLLELDTGKYRIAHVVDSTAGTITVYHHFNETWTQLTFTDPV